MLKRADSTEIGFDLRCESWNDSRRGITVFVLVRQTELQNMIYFLEFLAENPVPQDHNGHYLLKTHNAPQTVS